MKVDLIDSLGSDLTVVNAARVSFDKESWWANEEDWLEFDATLELKESDKKLIKYLAKHKHWSPFAHPQIQLRISAPIFVARQLAKHQVGFVWNEVSRRYVDSPPKLYTPAVWRSRPTDGAKQGSHPTEEGSWQSIWGYDDHRDDIQAHYDDCLSLYERMVEDGVAPEQARMVLPQSMFTEWYWTGSLAGFARMYNERTDAHSQAETSFIAEECGKLIQPLFPTSWEVLTNG